MHLVTPHCNFQRYDQYVGICQGRLRNKPVCFVNLQVSAYIVLKMCFFFFILSFRTERHQNEVFVTNLKCLAFSPFQTCVTFPPLVCIVAFLSIVETVLIFLSTCPAELIDGDCFYSNATVVRSKSRGVCSDYKMSIVMFGQQV